MGHDHGTATGAHRRRLLDPPKIGATLMLTVALVGLVTNAVSLAVLHRAQGESLNVRGAYLEEIATRMPSRSAMTPASSAPTAKPPSRQSR